MVTEEGTSGEAPGRNAGAFVQALLDLRDTYNRFLMESFAADQLFKNAIASVSQYICLDNIMHRINTCMYVYLHNASMEINSVICMYMYMYIVQLSLLHVSIFRILSTL